MLDTAEARKEYHTIPHVLYKFLPPEGVIALSTRSLKCTHPRDFADTSDSFHVTSEGISHGINVVGSPFYFQKTDPVTQLPAQGALAEMREWCEQSVQAYPGMTVECCILVPPMPDEALPEFVDGFQTQMAGLEERYALCLTQQSASPTMWDYYAKGHRGFVLGFSSKSSFLKRGDNSHLKRIMYTDQVSTGPWEVAIWRRWLIKRSQYSHEEEWRAMYSKERLRKLESGSYVIDFADKDLIQIIVGSRADDNTIDSILKLKPEHAQVMQEYLNTMGEMTLRPISAK